jgi:hypothetical protein
MTESITYLSYGIMWNISGMAIRKNAMNWGESTCSLDVSMLIGSWWLFNLRMLQYCHAIALGKFDNLKRWKNCWHFPGWGWQKEGLLPMSLAIVRCMKSNIFQTWSFGSTIIWRYHVPAYNWMHTHAVCLFACLHVCMFATAIANDPEMLSNKRKQLRKKMVG